MRIAVETRATPSDSWASSPKCAAFLGARTNVDRLNWLRRALRTPSVFTCAVEHGERFCGNPTPVPIPPMGALP